MPIQISFWLIPSIRYRCSLSQTIRSLAIKHGGPVFEPHVTVYSGLFEEKQYGGALHSASAIGKVVLAVKTIEFGQEFHKAMFVSFFKHEALAVLSRVIATHSANSLYSIQFHLSLFYGSLNESQEKKMELDARINWTSIEFDELRAVHTPKVITETADLAEWNVLGSVKLGQPGVVG